MPIEIAIFLTTLVSMSLLGFLRPIRDWFISIKSQPVVSVLFFLIIIGAFFLSGVRIEGSGRELLDPIRLARMAIFLIVGIIHFINLAVRFYFDKYGWSVLGYGFPNLLVGASRSLTFRCSSPPK